MLSARTVISNMAFITYPYGGLGLCNRQFLSRADDGVLGLSYRLSGSNNASCARLGPRASLGAINLGAVLRFLSLFVVSSQDGDCIFVPVLTSQRPSRDRIRHSTGAPNVFTGR